jgi:hopanoid biosynthesis associated protein HpnK
MALVIVNADDFGRSRAVNAAVERAHREGILTSASLMVTGDAADEAVALARALPRLAVGLHLVLAQGRPALPPAEIPRLAPGGRFRDDPVRTGLACFFQPGAHRDLALEIGAQFDRFAATGLPLSHVDGHLNLQVHPSVLPRALELAVRHGARAIRLPREGMHRALADGWPRRLAGAAEAIALDVLGAAARSRVRRRGLAVADEVHGVLRAGRMDESYLLRLLAGVRGPTAEIYLHPSLEPLDLRGPNPGDLAALLSPAVRRAIDANGHVLGTWAALGRR